jgi:cellulose synthase/poly-beta-1,6-N-acetylglucosamine synthase-like glycosyltransferase
MISLTTADSGHITPLPDSLAARRLLGRGQVAFLGALAAAFVVIASSRAVGWGPSSLWWANAVVTAITVGYVAAIGFMVLAVFCAGGARVVRAESPVPDDELPLYTVLVHVPAISQAAISALSRIDYPRLQVLLLAPAEPGDVDTRMLPSWAEVVPVPPDGLYSKAIARDAGLERAAGEFCVVYDADDLPAAGQLREAVAAFRALPAWVVCVQAQLRYSHPGRTWLARCFGAEYAVSFGLFLRGLDRLGLVIPLSNTSHHFRTEALQRVGGWDVHNASEGTDLGVRIARRGWRVRIMASATEKKEATDWLAQRTRWMLGYYQTWLVHMRSPGRLWRDVGARRFIGLQLTMAAYLTALANPLFWALTVAYLASGQVPHGYFFLYAGGAAMLLGNLLMAYSLMLGCMEHGLFRAVRTMLLVPGYWALISVAAYRALFQLRPQETS